MGILNSLRKKAVATGLAGTVLMGSFNDYLTRSNVDSMGSSAYAADRSRQENENEFLRRHPPTNIFSNNPPSQNRTHNHSYNQPHSLREMQDYHIIQDMSGIMMEFGNYLQRENHNREFMEWLRQQNQVPQNQQRQQNNSWIRGYVYNRWEDRDWDRKLNTPSELVGWNKNSFYENEPLFLRLSAGNHQGSNYSFILFNPNNKGIYFDGTNIGSNNDSHTWDLSSLNQQKNFLDKNGEGVYTLAFYINNNHFKTRRFNWLKNRPVTTNPRIVAAPLPPPVILPQRTEEVGRYSSLLGYELKADNDARRRNVLVHKEDKNHDGDCRFWAGLILENRVDNFKGKDFGFSIYDSAGNRRAHWHGEISRNWRQDHIGIAESFSFHDYKDGEYNLVVKWPDETETSKVFYIRDSN